MEKRRRERRDAFGRGRRVGSRRAGMTILAGSLINRNVEHGRPRLSRTKQELSCQGAAPGRIKILNAEDAEVRGGRKREIMEITEN